MDRTELPKAIEGFVTNMHFGRKVNGNRSGFTLLEVAIVMLVVLIIAGMAIPKVMTIIQNLRTTGDVQSLNSDIMLAKMQAASDFAHARVHADLNSQTYWVEVWPTGATSWTMEGGIQYLAKNVTFGYGSLASPPSNTQSAIGQALTCSGVSGTACITFNSRGIPIDPSTNGPTGNDALYVTDGKSVSGVTVSGTGLSRIWRTEATAANWKQE
jgi:prepilin-type N-terminal cleavage/methylation domain-containing protein